MGTRQDTFLREGDGALSAAARAFASINNDDNNQSGSTEQPVKMSTAYKIEPREGAVPFQEASVDIWDKKYRLTAKDGTPIDQSMDDTYKRVAVALADVEAPEARAVWHERFLWALRKGAIPAGRITSNAGALDHKPATSTINCTVSGTIIDNRPIRMKWAI